MLYKYYVERGKKFFTVLSTSKLMLKEFYDEEKKEGYKPTPIRETVHPITIETRR